jgi:hypothetical protein
LAAKAMHAYAQLTDSHQSPEPFGLRVASWMSYDTAHKAGGLVRLDRKTNYGVPGVTVFRIKEPKVAREESRPAKLEKQRDDLLVLDSRSANVSTDLMRPDSPASQKQALIFGNVLVKYDHQWAGSATSSSAWLSNASRASRTASPIASLEIDPCHRSMMASQAIPRATSSKTSLTKTRVPRNVGRP